MTQFTDNLAKYLNEGMVEFETNEDASRFSKAVKIRYPKGPEVHVNVELKLPNGTVFKPSVEMCQGAHCHCRY